MFQAYQPISNKPFYFAIYVLYCSMLIENTVPFNLYGIFLLYFSTSLFVIPIPFSWLTCTEPVSDRRTDVTYFLFYILVGGVEGQRFVMFDSNHMRYLCRLFF